MLRPKPKQSTTRRRTLKRELIGARLSSYLRVGSD
jgi:hypothetical protein